jgi:hypothetical protein
MQTIEEKPVFTAKKMKCQEERPETAAIAWK